MTDDDTPRAARPSAEQREAARRALEQERQATGSTTGAPAPLPPWPTPTPGQATSPAGGPAAAGGDGGGSAAAPPGAGDEVPGARSRTPLVLGLLGAIVVVAVAVVLLAGGSEDDGPTAAESTSTTAEPEAASPSTTPTTEATTAPSSTEATATSTLSPALPPPAGAPMPTLDLATDDIEQLAEQTSAFRLWLYANPDVAMAAQITAPGSQARQRLVDEIGRLEQAGQLAIYEGYSSEVDEAGSEGDVAEATWAELYDRYLVYDAATGQVVIDLPGVPLAGFRLAWARSDAGQWLLTDFVGG